MANTKKDTADWRARGDELRERAQRELDGMGPGDTSIGDAYAALVKHYEGRPPR